MRLGIALALAAALALFLWLRPSEPTAESTWNGVATSYSPGPRGTKALYLLAEGLGLRVRRLRRPTYDRLGPGVTLWDLADAPLGPLERRWLLAFVREGGTLVAGPEPLSRLFSEAGLGDPDLKEEEGPVHASVGPSPTVERSTALAGLAPPEALFAADAEGRPVVAAFRVGLGRIVFLGLPEAARNDQIGREGNGPFFARLATTLGGELLFDEFQAGFGDATPWRLLTHAPYRWGLAQLCLALLAGLAALVPRRLPAEPPEPVRRRQTGDQIAAIARLWAAGGDPGLPLESLMRAAEQRARARLCLTEPAAEPGGPTACFVAWVAAARPELALRARDAWARATSITATGTATGKAGPRPTLERARRSAVELALLEREVVTW